MNINLERAINALGKATQGRFDIWQLAGPRNASTRSAIMSQLMGRKITQAQSGVTAIRDAFYDALQLHGTGTCPANREDAFIRMCHEYAPEFRQTAKWF